MTFFFFSFKYISLETRWTVWWMNLVVLWSTPRQHHFGLM